MSLLLNMYSEFAILYSWVTQAWPNNYYLCSSIYSPMISSHGSWRKLWGKGSLRMTGSCDVNNIETELNMSTLISKFTVFKLATVDHCLPIPLWFLQWFFYCSSWYKLIYNSFTTIFQWVRVGNLTMQIKINLRSYSFIIYTFSKY